MAAPIEKKPSGKPKLYASAALALVALMSLGYWIWYLQPPPQMGTDEEVFKTVDALYTAVTARDEKLLSECERRLHELRDARRLTPDAAVRLDSLIGRARSGNWESAARSLYDFMIGQRRAGRGDRKKGT